MTPSNPTESQPTFAEVGDEKFVSLTTYRRNGVPVSSPVWIAADGDDLIVTTPKESGKVKRLRNDRRIEIRPCNRRGVVKPDAPTLKASAVVIDDDAARARLTQIFQQKYRWEYRIFLFIERLVARRQKVRVEIRITAGTSSKRLRAGSSMRNRP